MCSTATLALALFFAIVLNPLVTRSFIRRGVKRPLAITIVVVVMLIVLYRAGARLCLPHRLMNLSLCCLNTARSFDA